jgi:hypothetical protein
MRKTISVAALLLALTCPAYAGDIQNDKPQANTAQEPSGGEMQNGIMPNGYIPNGIDDSMTQIALNLLAVLL